MYPVFEFMTIKSENPLETDAINEQASHRWEHYATLSVPCVINGDMSAIYIYHFKREGFASATKP